MRKCKRNILLIFGYLIFMGILFLPSQRINYSFQVEETLEIKRIRNEGKYSIVFLPYFLKRGIKYQKYKEWESSLEPMIIGERDKHKNYLNENLKNVLEKEIKELEGKREKGKSSWADKLILKYKLEEYTEFLELENNKAWLNQKIEYRLELYSKELKEKSEKEFECELKNKFGEQPYYNNIDIEIFITILSSIIFLAGFAYILFCVVLRKEKRGE